MKTVAVHLVAYNDRGEETPIAATTKKNVVHGVAREIMRELRGAEYSNPVDRELARAEYGLIRRLVPDAAER